MITLSNTLMAADREINYKEADGVDWVETEAQAVFLVHEDEAWPWAVQRFPLKDCRLHPFEWLVCVWAAMQALLYGREDLFAPYGRRCSAAHGLQLWAKEFIQFQPKHGLGEMRLLSSLLWGFYGQLMELAAREELGLIGLEIGAGLRFQRVEGAQVDEYVAWFLLGEGDVRNLARRRLLDWHDRLAELVRQRGREVLISWKRTDLLGPDYSTLVPIDEVVTDMRKVVWKLREEGLRDDEFYQAATEIDPIDLLVTAA